MNKQSLIYMYMHIYFENEKNNNNNNNIKNITCTVQYIQSHTKSFENSVGIGEISCNKQFIFSHSVLYPFGELSAIVVCKPFSLEESKICHFGKGLALAHKSSESYFKKISN